MEYECFSADESFQLHMYRKNELASQYFPNLSKGAASRNLRRWIINCKPLLAALESIGYDKYRKFFLRPEVELIVHYLGIP